jgi:hypothetical protein
MITDLFHLINVKMCRIQNGRLFILTAYIRKIGDEQTKKRHVLQVRRDHGIIIK